MGMISAFALGVVSFRILMPRAVNPATPPQGGVRVSSLGPSPTPKPQTLSGLLAVRVWGFWG